MKKFICFLSLLTFWTVVASAQSGSWHKLYGYEGVNGLRPGVFYAMEFRPSLSRKKANGKYKFLMRSYDLSINGIYHHKNQLSFSNYYRIKWRSANTKGLRIYSALGVGLQRTFYPETYAYIDGKVERKFLAGRFYPTINSALGFEYGKLKSGHRIVNELSFNFLLGYNAAVLPMLSLKIGLIK